MEGGGVPPEPFGVYRPRLRAGSLSSTGRHLPAALCHFLLPSPETDSVHLHHQSSLTVWVFYKVSFVTEFLLSVSEHAADVELSRQSSVRHTCIICAGSDHMTSQE